MSTAQRSLSPHPCSRAIATRARCAHSRPFFNTAASERDRVCVCVHKSCAAMLFLPLTARSPSLLSVYSASRHRRLVTAPLAACRLRVSPGCPRVTMGCSLTPPPHYHEHTHTHTRIHLHPSPRSSPSRAPLPLRRCIKTRTAPTKTKITSAYSPLQNSPSHCCARFFFFCLVCASLLFFAHCRPSAASRHLCVAPPPPRVLHFFKCVFVKFLLIVCASHAPAPPPRIKGKKDTHTDTLLLQQTSSVCVSFPAFSAFVTLFVFHGSNWPAPASHTPRDRHALCPRCSTRLR